MGRTIHRGAVPKPQPEGAPAWAVRLREMREAAGHSQSELGRRAGVHERSIGRYEQGEVSPTVFAALALAAALGCTVEHIFACGN